MCKYSLSGLRGLNDITQPSILNPEPLCEATALDSLRPTGCHSALRGTFAPDYSGPAWEVKSKKRAGSTHAFAFSGVSPHCLRSGLDVAST